jgi:thiamine-monophosphate kinase
MLLSDIGELGIIEHIKKQFSGYQTDVQVGIGDDAAVIKSDISGNDNSELLVTTDLMTQDIHFSLSYTTYYQLGFKLISINVSDIYAMGGSPKYALLALAFPKDTKEHDLNDFFAGVSDALRIYKAVLIGGDTSSSIRDITISATMLGYGQKPILRSTAKIGDKIYVTGHTGDSACGMELLKRINKPIAIENGYNIDTPLDWETMSPLIIRHLMPKVKKPQFEGLKINSMMDISDGLAIDLKKLCNASKVGAVIYQDRLPMSTQMLEVAKYLGIDPLKLCLGGGEDYEYLFTSKDEITSAYCIGQITNEGNIIIDKNNRETQLVDYGYEHFK